LARSAGLMQVAGGIWQALLKRLALVSCSTRKSALLN